MVKPLLVLLLGCTCHDAPANPPPLPPIDGTVRDVIGINEPVGLPKKFVHDLPDGARRFRIQSAIDRLGELGVTHVRLHSATYPFLSRYGTEVELGGDRGPADAYLTQILAAGLEPLVMIGPWPGNGTAEFTQRYVPDDLDAYAAWVTATVERYDGDGIDDAPGLSRGVHMWEIDNEPDLHNFASPKNKQMPVGFDPHTFETAPEFAQVVKVTAAAIRAADPDAVVLHGGIWRPFEERGRTYLETLAETDGFLAATDGINLHAYPPQGFPPLWKAVDHASAYGKPVWVTETSTKSIGGRKTPASQAEDLVVLVLEALRRGLARVYWHSLVEGPDMYDPNPHDRGMHGRHLYAGRPEDVEQLPGHRQWKQVGPKPAATALKSLLTRWGDVPRDKLTEVTARNAFAMRIGDDIAVWRTDRRGASTAEVPVPWNKVTATRLIPPFETTQLKVHGGVVTVDLEPGPTALSAR